jgi:trehalose-phosphatase
VVALHYRRAAADRVPDVERTFLRVVERHRRAVMMGRGHCVLEARLRGNCNKGTALRFIRRQLPSATLIVYFGDDITDRDAFRALKGLGVSVQVGTDDPGLADYTLPDASAVVGALLRIDERLRARSTRVRKDRR